MNSFDFKCRAEDEVRNVLDYNGFSYTEKDGAFRMTLRSAVIVWDTLIRTSGERMSIFSSYLIAAPETDKARALCCEICREMFEGAFFISDGVFTLRISRTLNDGYFAYENIGGALEYSAAAMVKYAARFSAFAENQKRAGE